MVKSYARQRPKSHFDNRFWSLIIVIVSTKPVNVMRYEFPNIRHMLALTEVAETRRIGTAAARVHLSQPALTQAIAKLEDRVGAPLFERRSNGLFLTEIGEVFTARIARVIDRLKLGEAQVLRRAGKGARRDFHRLTTPVQLRALMAIAAAGSYSHAARQLGISQPAVHRAASDLEKLARVPIFEPVRRGVGLTPAGEALVHHVRLALGEVRQGFYEVSEVLGRETTQIFVGSLPLSRSAVLPRAMDAILREAGPGLPIHNIDGPYQTLLRALRNGEVDFLIGALRDPPPAEDVVQVPVFDDHLSVVAGVQHPLHDTLAPTLEDSLAYPWIAPPKEAPTGTYLFDVLRIPDLPNSPVRIVSSSLVLVRGLMMRGDYVTVMSRRQFEVEEALGVLKSLPIPLPGSNRSIGLTWREGWSPTPRQARFIELIKSQASNLADDFLQRQDFQTI